ncbi:hypothetical protein HNP72_000074 [Sphingobacterium soli]|nr:hypothetical protein [Sphingobacterium soli]
MLFEYIFSKDLGFLKKNQELSRLDTQTNRETTSWKIIWKHS